MTTRCTYKREIRSISTTNFEDRIEDLVSLLNTLDPEERPGKELDGLRLYVNEHPINMPESLQIEVLESMLTDYHLMYYSSDDFTCKPQLVLLRNLEDTYILRLETYFEDGSNMPREIELSEDLLREYLKLFHNKFYDASGCKTPLM